jgi:hypothetical protein
MLFQCTHEFRLPLLHDQQYRRCGGLLVIAISTDNLEFRTPISMPRNFFMLYDDEKDTILNGIFYRVVKKYSGKK